MIAVDYSSSTSFNEDAFEQGIIDHLQTSLGYEHLYGPDVARSSDAFDDAFLPDVIGPALESINPTLNRRAIDASITRLKEIEGSDLIAKNSIFMDMLQNGVEASWFDGKEEHTDIVRLVDYDNPEKNCFHVVNQWTYIERGTNKRPDVIVFVNGLPLVLFELKSPARADADSEDAYQQIQNYKRQIPSLFVYNAFCVTSDMLHTKVGTITANESRFAERRWELRGRPVRRLENPSGRHVPQGAAHRHPEELHSVLRGRENPRGIPSVLRGEQSTRERA